AATMGNEYEPLIVLPDRRVVAIRRTYGHGWITVLGIDIASGRLLSQQIVDGDVLWNRILGRRSDSPRPTELQAMKSAALKGVYTGRPSAEVSLTPPSLLENWTSKSQEAGRALLLAVLLFFLYWIAAGPGGFALLRQYKQARHAWLVFVAAAGVFTAITWGSVGLLRQRYTEIGHVTFLDHIAQPPGRERLDEPQYQRIMSWFSAFLPSYGATPIALDGPADERSNQVLHAFNPPRRLIDRFPNSDRYRVDIARTPASFDVPSRATAKMFEAEWLGAVDTAWGGMIRVDPADPLHIVNDGTSVGRLTGTLTHDLPGTLTNIQVFYVSANRTPPRRYQRSGEAILPYLPTSDQGELPNVGRMWSLANEYATWTPGIALDLGSVLGRPTAQNDLRLGIDKRYVDTYRGRAADGSLDQLTRAAARDYLEMLSIYQMLTPPAYFQTQNQTLSPVRFSRDTARRLDLSTWFSTPCVIVIAYLENSASPLPVLIDGRPPVRNEGLTIVRWIYPLPVDPEVAFTRAETENAG
ncbi:MAG: hypothetical protein KDA25_05760, partial [Phycisphaerales bacterium]|nr:hypothetical protein [Phycisphaerales bacterium]